MLRHHVVRGKPSGQLKSKGLLWSHMLHPVGSGGVVGVGDVWVVGHGVGFGGVGRVEWVSRWLFELQVALGSCELLLAPPGSSWQPLAVLGSS